jgi:membrane-associated phospholipid phosphatase
MQEFLVRVMADWSVVPVVMLGIYALIYKIPKGGRMQAYSRILVAGLTAYLIAKLLGAVYQPSLERPFEILGTVAGASFLNNPGFPSDHVLFVTAILLAVWFETRQRLISIILLALVAIICIGRVAALVHAPIDVIGGVLIAMFGAVWYINPTRSSSK